MKLVNIEPKRLSHFVDKSTFLSTMALRFYPDISKAQHIVDKMTKKTKTEIVTFFQSLWETKIEGR